MPVVVNLRHQKFDIYIGRDCYGFPKSKWHNPFREGRDGDRQEVIRKYEAYLRNQRADLIDQLPELRGKILGCWCKPAACHGDVLVRLLEEFHGQSTSDKSIDSILSSILPRNVK